MLILFHSKKLDSEKFWEKVSIKKSWYFPRHSIDHIHYLVDNSSRYVGKKCSCYRSEEMLRDSKHKFN